MRTSTVGNRSPASAGFTLLELMVVLILAGAAMLVVVPSLSRGMTGIELDASARDLITRMKRARSQAIAQQEVFRVIFVREEETDSPGQLSDSYLLADAYEEPIRSYALPVGILVKKETDQFPLRISFYPNGRSSGGWILLGSDRQQVGVWVDPITGFAKAFKDASELERFEQEYS